MKHSIASFDHLLYKMTFFVQQGHDLNDLIHKACIFHDEKI